MRRKSARVNGKKQIIAKKQIVRAGKLEKAEDGGD
jgi:hypothetical protein